jgi:hypothetical protein
MAKQKQQGGSGSARGMSSRPGTGKQGQAGETSRDDASRTSDAQQDQGGEARQQGGDSGRERADERLDADIQSGSSPRASADSPDEGKVG